MNDDSLIDELLDRWEEAADRGETISAEELCAECPELRDEVERRIQALGAIDRRFQTDLADITDADDREAKGQSIDDVEVQSDFRELRFHAKGGLGSVYRAVDERLKRDIAVKFIHHRLANRQESRDRFALEAEVTGLLDHPGVVPLYGLGETHDGRMFYAMRFVDGDTLSDAIAEYHKSLETDRRSSERSLQFRKLLGHFIDVCNVVDYAHSRGVLHRDIKPGNVMLGQHSETVLVDWGLAKLFQEEGDPNVNDSTEQAQAKGSGSSSKPTQMGSMIGTPTYMSPEQAEGDVDRIGPASDVYSLGATLYCILTGRAPHEGDSLEGILKNVRHGKYPRPRSVNAEIPKPLEAVCIRAMALAATDRYSSAVELAGDVERWLADEPVIAYAEPITERVRRWMRQHQTAVTTSAAIVLLATVGLAVVSAVIGRQKVELARQNEKLEIANIEIRKAEQRAIVGERKAKQLVANLLVNEAQRFQLDRFSGWSWKGLKNLNEAVRQDRHSIDFIEARTLAASFLAGFDIRHWRDFAQGDTSHDSVFDPTGQWLAIGRLKGSFFESGKVTLIDLQTEEPTELYFPPSPSAIANARQDGVRSLCFSPSGKQLLAGTRYGWVYVWNLDRLKESPQGKKVGSESIHQVIFSPDGKSIYTVSSKAIIRWNCEGDWTEQARHNTDSKTELAMKFDGLHLVTSDGWLKLDPVSLRSIDRLGDPIGELFGLWPGIVVPSELDGVIHLRDEETGESFAQLVDPDLGERAHASISGLSMSSDSQYLASGGSGHLKVWDVANGKTLARFTLGATSSTRPTFSPDGKLIATPADDSVRVYETRTSSVMQKVAHSPRPIRGIAWYPDSLHLVVVAGDDRPPTWVGVWNVKASEWNDKRKYAGGLPGEDGVATDVSALRSIVFHTTDTATFLQRNSGGQELKKRQWLEGLDRKKKLRVVS